MSKNCMQCVTNERTGTDLLCDACRSVPPTGSDDFTYRIPATDGGLPFDFIDRRDDDYDCASVYRGDEDLGIGTRLIEAWDNYLYSISPHEAPIERDALSAMWTAYDTWRYRSNTKERSGE